MINYKAFLDHLNWREFPLERPAPPRDYPSGDNWHGNDMKTQIQSVCVQALVDDLTKKKE